MTTVKVKRLGEILVEAGTITEEKLDLALREQQQTREKLGAVLIRLGICSGKSIAKVLAEQAGVECVDLATYEVDRQVVQLLDRAFIEQRSVLPIRSKGSSLTVAMAQPLDLATIDEMSRMTGMYVEVVHASDSNIADALVRYMGTGEGQEGDIPTLIEAAQRALADGVKPSEGNSPFISLVSKILEAGVTEGATDLHIEPEERVLRCRYRIDGKLVQGAILPIDLLSIVITRIKILAEMNISESRVPQDGRIELTVGRKKVDLRVSTFPTVHGEGVVCRVLDKECLMVGLEQLGMPKSLMHDFQQDITRPHGIILVTGPTGSGKTTTLYSALTFLNRPDTKIITLEDPVEYELPVINQAQINTAKGFTFAKGLRAILRQDPDILLVGEIRDKETAQLAIRAALTGHLVFSTLHTNSAAGAIPRLLDMGVESFLLSASLISVLAQRLVRKVCPECGQMVEPTPEQLGILDLDRSDLPEEGVPLGRGCDMCRDSGYRGRMAIFEYLQVTEEIRQMVSDGKDVESIKAVANKNGQLGLRDDGLAKLRAGKTSLPEVMKVLG
jgi:type IV pilus assembly protein PilB